MARIISTTAIINWVRMKLNSVPSPDGNSAYGRFYLLATGQLGVRLPGGTDWLAAKSDHTHASVLPTYGVGEANKYLQVDPTGAFVEWDAAGGVTDHGALTGLADDDHPQYHNNTRGDLRYAPIANSHVAATVLDSSNIDLGLSGQQITADLKPTTVAAGSYSGADITVDANGRLTSAATGANNHAPVTILDSSNIDLGLTGQQITADLKPTTVAAGSYAAADITVDANGRITAAATGAIVANSHVAATVLGGTGIDLSITGQQISASLINTAVTPGTYNLTTLTVDAHGRITSAVMGYMERAIVSVTASKTLALTDRGTKQMCSSASAIVISVPTNAAVAFPVGTEIDIYRNGAGAVSLLASGGVTIRTAGTLAITAQWRAAHLTQVSANEWILIGAV